MKTLNPIALILFLALTLGACSSKMTFQNSSKVPAATGEVKVKKDKNNNYDLTVNVYNLAKPEQLSPAREVYMVWMDSNQGITKRLGQIKISSGLMSKSLSGELESKAIDKPDRVFITAENDPETLNPSSEVILTTGR
ncbi:hypothetical protein [Persicitalea sp.]|uniref:hypothetical protein n=1 Tax=Persicitalea sp. TaxID=3100273 RepID=UPI0035941818